MKPETFEIVIEELANALNIERWKNKMAEAEISELKNQIKELLKERDNG
jgi:hypothetical protein